MFKCSNKSVVDRWKVYWIGIVIWSPFSHDLWQPCNGQNQRSHIKLPPQILTCQLGFTFNSARFLHFPSCLFRPPQSPRLSSHLSPSPGTVSTELLSTKRSLKVMAVSKQPATQSCSSPLLHAQQSDSQFSYSISLENLYKARANNAQGDLQLTPK